jgi:sugar phosphate permease
MVDAAAPRQPARLSHVTRKRQWILVALLVGAACVNYLDRSTLAIANHDIASELHFSPAEMGALLSAFAWTYALFQLPAGILADRYGPRAMLGAGMVLWSLAQLVSGTVQGFGQFIAARAGLGFGESPMFTAGARACVNWFPPADRGVPLGLFNAASSLGPAIAPPLLTALMLAFGWRPMFLIMGVAGLVSALIWMIAYREPEQAGIPQVDLDRLRASNAEGTAVAAPRAWAALFAVPSTWALMGGLFGIVYITWLYVTWLPAYLETIRHVSVAQTGILAALPQAAGFVGGCLGGFVSDWLAHRDIEPVLARKIPTVAGLALAGLLTGVAPLAGNTGIALALMSLAMFFAYGAGSCSWALGASLTPPAMVATLESIQNIGGSIGGALAPLVTGLVVQHTGGFTPAFLVASVAALLSAVSYAFVRPDAYAGLGTKS